MNYQIVKETYQKEDYLQSTSQLKQYLLYAQKVLGEWNCEAAQTYHICGVKKEDKYIAVGLACVYRLGKCTRNTQWKFKENANRELWIDTLLSEEKGYGHVVLGELEQFLVTYKDTVVRKNIYVRPVEKVGGYYHKYGYEEIWTPEHKDDEDSACTFQADVI